MMKFKTLVIDEALKQCYINDELVDLTKNEYNILLFLLNNRNYIYSRKELIQNNWDKKVGERAVDTCIRRLRKKLKNYKTNLITRKGFGYGFKED